jgi:hypothetical protein
MAVEILLMDGTDAERECRGYLESIGVNEPVELWGHKHLAKINGADTFHKIAQSTATRSIGNFDESLSFYMSVKEADWLVALDAHDTEDFLTRYGGQYQIIKR